MALSPEAVSAVAVYRAKAANNTLTIEDMREAVRLLRGDRIGAHVASDKSRRAKAKVEVPSADDMLRELEGL